MSHGVIDAFAFQEALLIEVAFGLAILVMAWLGFRRWLQHKERMSRLLADQTAELAAHYGALVERVEARLAALEENRGEGRALPIGEGPVDSIGNKVSNSEETSSGR